MAGMRKLKGKWYVRVFLENGKEKLLPTKTGDKKQAEAFKRRIQEREFLVRAKLEENITQTATNLNDAIEEYLADCRSRLRHETYLNYELALKNLQSCWGDIDLRQLTALHFTTLRKYLSTRVSTTSVNIRLRAIRAFLNWVVATGKLERLPGKLALIKIDDELPKFFTPAELDEIMAEITDPKMKATIRLLTATGLRRSELAMCTLKDGYLHLQHTKGRRDRLVALPIELLPEFELIADSPYHPDSISRAFRTAMKAAGINAKGRSLHSLRHTFALREYYRTGDIYYVKGLLGHAHVTVTERYLKFPREYLEKVFGESVTPFHTHQLWAELSQEKPAIQA